jgi:hypothetical protein
MNERIKQLAEQAGYYLYDLTETHECKTVETDSTDEWITLEKFAELIVRECMAQCEQVAEDADAMAKSTFVTDVGRMIHDGAWGGAKNCTAQIREHFGVEE